MDENKQLEILRNTRHDWMNVVQIIKGNIALRHMDRVEEILNDTIRKTEHESRLSQLRVPSTAIFLLTFNWNSHWFHLDIEVTSQKNDCSPYENCWYEILASFTQELDKAVKPGADNQLQVTVHALEEPYLEFDFQGELKNTEEIGNWFALFSHSGTCYLKDIVWNQNELMFIVLNNK